MLVVNKSKLTQVVYGGNFLIPQFIHPGMIVDSEFYTDLDKNSFEVFNKFYLFNCKRLAFIRQYALGDIIQLIASARFLKRIANIGKITIITSQSFADALRYMYSDIEFVAYNAGTSYTSYDLILTLDGILESDHSLKNMQNSCHRADIYLKAFGIVEQCPIDYDLWKPVYLKEIDMIQSERKLIGIQLRGSGVMKTLPCDYIRKLVAELSQKYTVVLLDQSADKGFSGDNVIDMCGKTTTHQCVALLKQLAMVITMDSGMLWLAHAANCPVLTLLGPTREQERLSLHPQYPEKAKSINLSEMIGCVPCFETCPKCYRRVDCMNLFNHEELTRAIMNKIEQIVGVE